MIIIREINPTAISLNLGVDYTLSDMLAFSFSNGYTALAGTLHNMGDVAGADSFSDVNADDMYGYYGKNKIGLGAVITPEENMTISIDFGYTMFLGLPSASDLYVTGLTADQENAVDVAFDEWIDSEFNPYSASVTYKYSY